MRVLFFLFLFVIQIFAAEKVAEFKSPNSFSGAELFQNLDKIGDNGNWMNYDSLALQDPELKPLLKDNILSAWVLEKSKDKILFARLLKRSKGEVLEIYELPHFKAPDVPLEVHEKIFLENVLQDYRGVRTNEFEHVDNPNLKIKISEKRILFSYQKPDATPLRFYTNFAKLSFDEKERVLSEYLDFFHYEYAVMLRAFVQSTSGIFNYQSWHWYLDSWNKKYFISKEELAAIFEKGAPPAMYKIFKVRAKRDCVIEMRASGNGAYEMEIISP